MWRNNQANLYFLSQNVDADCLEILTGLVKIFPLSYDAQALRSKAFWLAWLQICSDAEPQVTVLNSSALACNGASSLAGPQGLQHLIVVGWKYCIFSLD